MNKKPEIHTIRLQGPWNSKVLVFYRSSIASESQPDSTGLGEEAVGLERRCQVPSDWGDWLGNSFRGKVAYHRSFNKPTRLDPDQKVWLVLESVDFAAEVFLNDSTVGELVFNKPPLRVEIGSLLELSNRLRVEVDLPVVEPLPAREARAGLAGGLIGAVRIEIEEPAT